MTDLSLIKQTFTVVTETYDVEPEVTPPPPTPGFFRRKSSKPPAGQERLFDVSEDRATIT